MAIAKNKVAESLVDAFIDVINDNISDLVNIDDVNEKVVEYAKENIASENVKEAIKEVFDEESDTVLNELASEAIQNIDVQKIVTDIVVSNDMIGNAVNQTEVDEIVFKKVNDLMNTVNLNSLIAAISLTPAFQELVNKRVAEEFNKLWE